MVKQQSTVLVLGASGRLGRPLVAAFAREGWRVRAQMRDASRWQGKSWPDGVEPWLCNANQANDLIQAAQGATVLINALNPPYDQWKDNALLLANNAIAAALASGALLLFPGNIYNFGRELPEHLTEDTPQLGNTSKAAIRIAMEQSLREAAAEGVNSVVLRTGDYFGEEALGSWFDMIITKDLQKGKLVYPGPFDRKHAWTYLPDFAAAFVRVAARAAEIQGFRTYHVPGYAITGAELHSELEKIVGRHLKLSQMPWWPLRIAAPFSPMMRALAEMRYLWERSHCVEDGALSDLIGPLPSTALHDALKATVIGLGLLPASKGSGHV